MMRAACPLALTMGEPAGIGPDIAIAAWRARNKFSLPCFALVGIPGVIRDRAELLGLDCPVSEIQDIAGAKDAFAESLPVLPVGHGPAAMPGKPDPAFGEAIIAAIRRAVGLTLSGECAGVVTNPISKSALYATGFEYPGHTEYLAALSAEAGHEAEPVMMLASGEFRVVPATVHIPLKDVPASLSTERILSVIRTTAQGLKTYFGRPEARIAVTGVNPHAGENGMMGREEIEIVAPAIHQARREGYAVSGPFPADTLFHAAARTSYDAAIAMYHDQGLAPFKAVAFDTGVNVTLGLPFVRTSPDHGTAFGLAGAGNASASSLIAALRMADQMSRAPAAPR